MGGDSVMKVGIVLPAGGQTSWARLLELARSAESQGLDSVWMADHLIFRPPLVDEVGGTHENWTVMSALATSTRRVELGSLVMCASFRSPGLVAKMAATFDQIAPGRLVLGVGAGWHDPEYEAFGFPRERRVGRFGEWLEIVARLLRGERVTFGGRYYVCEEAVVLPAPGRRIPLLVGSRAPRMHSLAARWADGWNVAWYGRPEDAFDAEVKVFDEALAAADRDPASVLRTVGIMVGDPEQELGGGPPARFSGSVEELASVFAAYQQRDIGHVVVWPVPGTTRSVERVADAVRLHRAGYG
jgi:alkanesulfonate monooxygenase SsuD/methylene tetrahydromethanopterin reductase-like flavin-dependent oxidoreductase (luciferase family)